MVYICLILRVLAFCLFLISAVWNPQPQPSPWYGRLVAAGLACWVLSDILAGFPTTMK